MQQGWFLFPLEVLGCTGKDNGCISFCNLVSKGNYDVFAYSTKPFQALWWCCLWMVSLDVLSLCCLWRPRHTLLYFESYGGKTYTSVRISAVWVFGGMTVETVGFYYPFPVVLNLKTKHLAVLESTLQSRISKTHVLLNVCMHGAFWSCRWLWCTGGRCPKPWLLKGIDSKHSCSSASPCPPSTPAMQLLPIQTSVHPVWALLLMFQPTAGFTLFWLLLT